MSILGDKMQQTAGDNAVQIQGQTINVGMSYADVKDLCTSLIRSEIASYEQRANQIAQNRFDDIMAKLLKALSQIDEKYRMRFQEPAIQFAANETFKEFIRSGKEELSDDLIDLMIERIKVDEHTTKQALIDEARQIIPKLTTSSIAVLALLTFSKLIFVRNRQEFEKILQLMIPLVNELGSPQSLDIAYLEQVRCGHSFPSMLTKKGFIETMLHSYSPIFKHPITIEQFNQIATETGINQRDSQLFMRIVSLFETNGNLMTMNISTISDELFSTNKQDMADSLKLIVEKMPSYTKDEVKQFFIDLASNWQNVIALFNRLDIRSFTVSPVGYYIGCRKLSKLFGEEVPIETFFDNKTSHSKS